MRLKRIIDIDLRRTGNVAAEGVILALGVPKRDAEIVDTVQDTIHRGSVRRSHGHRDRASVSGRRRPSASASTTATATSARATASGLQPARLEREGIVLARDALQIA